ncbi:MAG: D-2-hydroxyacid dehydrogenase, partial [Flavobacteriales bacterium]
FYSPRVKEHPRAIYSSLEELFSQSDIITLHCPLTPDNNGFVNKSLLTLMKPSALLINTARGPLINEQDLADALNNNVIAGAALDVLSVEPPSTGNPLLRVKNCLITPHNAWMSKEARQRIMTVTEQNIAAFLRRKPINQVN